MHIVRRISYAVCIAAAAFLLLADYIHNNPPSRRDAYASVHPASTMAPMMGFSADALVNSGDAKALDTLPGIGEVISQRMVETRESLGGFRLPQDLLLVKGIGEKTLEKIMAALEEPLVQLPELDE